MSAVLVAADLSKWYGQVIAVNRVSFSIGPGVTGLLGPNGAGKSTLMKLMTGQLRPSQGDIRLFGEPLWNNFALYSRLGFCPEQDSFYERMTGRQFLCALLALHGLGGEAGAGLAAKALETVRLTDAADRKIGGYSKGMRQRIKLAQAVAHDPEVIILDEPLAGMDPVARRDTISLIRLWGRSGKCVVVSSHILHEIEAMTSTILLIHNGQVLAEGDVHAIRALIDRHPHSIHVRCSDPRQLAARLVGHADVLAVRFEPDGRSLTVQSARPDEFYDRLPALLLDMGVDLDEITSPDDNLQAVFHYLVK